MKINNIIAGFSNRMLDKFNKLDEHTKELSQKKLEICKSCPLSGKSRCLSSKSGECVESFYYEDEDEDRFKGEVYSGCGCYKIEKSMSKSQCPLGKWENIK